MLDLSQGRNKYEVKWFDGSIYHIKLPSQKTLNQLTAMANKKLKPEEQLDMMVSFLTEIFNKNDEGREFNKDEFAEIDFGTLEYILTDYLSQTYKKLGE